MSLLKSLKKRLVYQFIAVIIYETTCSIKIQRIQNSEIIFEEEKRFDIPSKDKLSDACITYLDTLQEALEQTYISLFLNTHGQGIVPSCTKNAYEKFHIDYDSVKHVCIDSSYSVYASVIDIRWVEKIFTRTGIDFIFSPFLILDDLIKLTQRSVDTTLYLLSGVNSITIMIFSDKKFLYGTFINIAKEEDLLDSEFENNSFAEASMEDEMMDEIDLDLDIDTSEEEIDDILDSDLEQISKEDEVIKIKNKLFGQDLRLVKYLDASLREFYDSDLYDSDFVSQVVLFDSAQINSEVLSHIEEELLVNILVIPTQIDTQLIYLSQKEVGYDA